jgi:Flp pilus assembly protein TadG
MTGRRRGRRGSTLVMVALMLVAIMGVTAIALDLGRFYVVNNELQTAVDAAALAGALQLQKSTLTSESALQDQVRTTVTSFVATQNRVDNAAFAIAPAAIELVFYDPTVSAEPIRYPAANGRTANAVAVGYYDQHAFKDSRPIFAQIIGRGDQRLRKRAVAWVANLSLNCVRPWGMPYTTGIYKAITGNTVAAPAPDLTQAQISSYMDATASNTALRRLTILGANQTSTLSNDGEWKGFNFSGNVGRPNFVDGIQGCRDYEVGTDASLGNTLPGQANQYVNWSSSVLWSNAGPSGGPGSGGSGLCYQASATNAGCFDPAATASLGVVIHTAWGDITGVGSDMLDFRVVGKSRLLCYYQSTSSVCPAPEPGTPNTGYPEGTIVLEVETLGSNIIDPETLLSSTVSLAQRLLLVK